MRSRTFKKLLRILLDRTSNSADYYSHVTAETLQSKPKTSRARSRQGHPQGARLDLSSGRAGGECVLLALRAGVVRPARIARPPPSHREHPAGAGAEGAGGMKVDAILRAAGDPAVSPDALLKILEAELARPDLLDAEIAAARQRLASPGCGPRTAVGPGQPGGEPQLTPRGEPPLPPQGSPPAAPASHGLVGSPPPSAPVLRSSPAQRNRPPKP